MCHADVDVLVFHRFFAVKAFFLSADWKRAQRWKQVLQLYSPEEGY